MASSGVNVKMGVSGIAQFKQNINQAKQAVKTLDAQIALSEKQFKATGDAESYMTEKSELLKAKLEQQKNVVANAEKALKDMADKGADRSSKAYQDLYRQMLTAKGEMIDTENEMNNVAAAGEDAAGGVDDLNTSLSEVGKGISWQNVTESLHTISDGMGKVIKKAWQLGEAIVRSTLGAGAWADELKTTAAQMSTAEYEVTPEELQRMRKTANLIDTDVDTIVKAKQKLAKGLGNGTKGTMSALEALGISGDGNMEDVFWAAGEAILKLSSDTEQEAQANALFGKSWKELIPLFQAGREEYDETMKSWNVVENDEIDALGKMDDQYQKLSGEWETFQNEILSTFAGPLTTGMEKLTGFVKELNEYLDTPEGQAMIKQLGETVTQLIEDLTKVSPEDVVNGLKGVVDGITDGLKWIAENSGTVVGAVEAFIGAWALIKTAEGVTTVLKLIDGIKGLSLGTSAAAAAKAGATVGSSWAASFASAALKAAPWLAGLTYMVTPSAGSDKVGNNDLVDSNGNLTQEAKQAGYDQNGNGEIIVPKRQYEYTLPSGGSSIATTGDAVDAGEMVNRRLSSTHAFEELQNSADKMESTATDLSKSTEYQSDATTKMTTAALGLMNLPVEVANAVINGMSGIVFTLDGTAITNYINQRLGQEINLARK